jgi:hypothetical protein
MADLAVKPLISKSEGLRLISKNYVAMGRSTLEKRIREGCFKVVVQPGTGHPLLVTQSIIDYYQSLMQGAA